MRVAWRDGFPLGLNVNAPRDAMPEGSAPRFEGVSPIVTKSVRSRWGSTTLYSLLARSLFRFSGTRFQQIGAPAEVAANRQLLRNGVLLTASLSGQRLSYAVMQVPVGTLDYLFVAGGGAAIYPAQGAGVDALPAQMLKVSAGGTMQRWGIQPATATLFLADDVGAGVLNGTYTYSYTYKNSTTGTRSNPVSTWATSVITVVNRVVRLTNVFTTPNNGDTQIDIIEIWRTVANGTVLFKLTEVAVGSATSINDNNADTVLTSEELQFDNTPPAAHFIDCVGPHQGRMWWGRIDTTIAVGTQARAQPVSGAPGRVVYGPIGRPESATGGFIELSDDTDAVQKLVIWGGALWAFCTKRVYQIIGDDEPFEFREQFGVPGTTQPLSVVGTPYGIVYEAPDGLRIFDGSQARLLGEGAISKLFRGETAEGLAVFSGDRVAAYARNEYWISDSPDAVGQTTLVVDLSTGRIRTLGQGLHAIYYEAEVDVIAATLTELDLVVSLENEGTLLEGGAGLSFEVESAGVLADVGHRALVQRLYFDLNTAGETLTPSVVIDGTVTALATINNAARAVVERNVGLAGRVISVRLAGTVSAQVELFSIEADAHLATPALGSDTR